MLKLVAAALAATTFTSPALAEEHGAGLANLGRVLSGLSKPGGFLSRFTSKNHYDIDEDATRPEGAEAGSPPDYQSFAKCGVEGKPCCSRDFCMRGLTCEGGTCVSAAPPDSPAECPSIVDVVSSEPSLSSLVDLISAADLTEALSDGSDELTVFAPTNRAIRALGPDVLAGLSQDPEALAEVCSKPCLAETLCLSNSSGIMHRQHMSSAASLSHGHKSCSSCESTWRQAL